MDHSEVDKLNGKSLEGGKGNDVIKPLSSKIKEIILKLPAD